MAKKLGWKDRVTYAKRESGIVNLGADELAKIAEVLGYSANDLGIFFTINVPNKERKQKGRFKYKNYSAYLGD